MATAIIWASKRLQIRTNTAVSELRRERCAKAVASPKERVFRCRPIEQMNRIAPGALSLPIAGEAGGFRPICVMPGHRAARRRPMRASGGASCSAPDREVADALVAHGHGGLRTPLPPLGAPSFGACVDSGAPAGRGREASRERGGPGAEAAMRTSGVLRHAWSAPCGGCVDGAPLAVVPARGAAARPCAVVVGQEASGAPSWAVTSQTVRGPQLRGETETHASPSRAPGAQVRALEFHLACRSKRLRSGGCTEIRSWLFEENCGLGGPGKSCSGFGRIFKHADMYFRFLERRVIPARTCV